MQGDFMRGKEPNEVIGSGFEKNQIAAISRHDGTDHNNKSLL
jgi:hypothetical protein